LVLPVYGPDGALIGVFDIDSDQPDIFNQTDANELQRMLRNVFEK
jgi:GAF domain-containing protein